MYFESSKREVDLVRLGSQPSQVLAQSLVKYKQGGTLPHLDTQHTSKFAQEREKDKCAGEEEEEVAEDILSLGILSWFDIVLSDGTILKELLGFFLYGFLEENLCVLVYCCACLSFNLKI